MSQPEAYGDAAQRLWDASHIDWHVSLSLILTEPVCAVVSVYPEYDDYPKLEGFLGTSDANESIGKACDYMLKNLETFLKDNPEKRPTAASQ